MNNPISKSTAAALGSVLRDIREEMHIEIKGWLDLATVEHKCVVAKAIIALANHGGGFIIVGFERIGEKYEEAANRPASFEKFNDDILNGIVQSYATPAFHCSVHFAKSTSGREYPIIVVPGGHGVPIQALRGAKDPDILSNGRIYIRRPGPQSAEPRSPEEWRELMIRCVRANRDELLDAVRDVLTGRVSEGESSNESLLDSLIAWAGTGNTDWLSKISGEDAERAPNVLGYMRIAYEIHDKFTPPSLSNLRDHMEKGAIRHTGWPEWIVFHRKPIAPYANNGALECFVGADDPQRPINDLAHADFWRATPEGRFLLLRGLQEDFTERVKPGKHIDITLPVWRVGEAFLHAASMCKQLGVPDSAVTITVRFSGLRDRTLTAIGGSRIMFQDRYEAHQNEIDLSTTFSADTVEDKLPEILFHFLHPLYNLFDLFNLSADLVIEELRRLRGNRF